MTSVTSAIAALATAFTAIDEANEADPSRVEWQGRLLAKARLQGERATYWLDQLDPTASSAVQVAARAHHLRRFALPRSSQPDGRVGYRRWRAAQKTAVAEEIDALLRPLGIADATLTRAIALAQRVGLGTDPETQLVEDAACLVFCETDLIELLAKIGEDKTADAIRKTLPKMSAAAITLAPSATPDGPARSLLLRVATGG